MADIFPVSRRQRIEVQHASQTISVLDIGRPGATGPQGPAGIAMQLGIVEGYNPGTNLASVNLGGLGIVPAKVVGGVPIWPYSTVMMAEDGTDWYVLGAVGRCVGFRDDFAHINQVSGVMHSDQAWNWGNSGAPGSLVAQAVYSGHEQFGCVGVTVAPTTSAFVTFVTQAESIAIPWFTSGGLWMHSRVIVGSARPNNSSACRVGMLHQDTLTWAALTANARHVAAMFHPSFHATNWLLEVANGTNTTSIATTVAVTDQTPYEIDLLWVPRFVSEGRPGFAGLWIDGTLRASIAGAVQIPEAFTAPVNATRPGITLATTNNVSKAILVDSFAAYSVSDVTLP